MVGLTMERQNIHKLNKTESENLINMLNSPDDDSVALGIEILRNIDLDDTETTTYLRGMARGITLKRSNLKQMAEIIDVFSDYLRLAI